MNTVQQVLHLIAQMVFWWAVIQAVGYFIAAMLEAIMSYHEENEAEKNEWRKTSTTAQWYIVLVIVLGVLLGNGAL